MRSHCDRSDVTLRCHVEMLRVDVTLTCYDTCSPMRRHCAESSVAAAAASGRCPQASSVSTCTSPASTRASTSTCQRGGQEGSERGAERGKEGAKERLHLHLPSLHF
eukprot:1195508-Prorocentrum_minimum.AAC.6